MSERTIISVTNTSQGRNTYEFLNNLCEFSSFEKDGARIARGELKPIVSKLGKNLDNKQLSGLALAAVRLTGMISGYKYLEMIAKQGLKQLKAYTPKDTGKTSESWGYIIKREGETAVIEWYNTNNTEDGHNVAVLLQYGHLSKNGNWVYGTDYINPAMEPILNAYADNIYREVVSS